METICGCYHLELSPGTFPLSTDSMVLADFVRLPPNARVLDLGSGGGTLGMLLCGKDPGCCVTGLELTDQGHQCAQENILRNQLQGRLYSICADLRAMPLELPLGKFDVCVSNPPYFSSGSPSRTTPLARREDCCSVEDLFAAARKALRYGGDFYLVHKPQRLAQLCAAASQAGLEPKRLLLVRHKEDLPISLIVLQCRRGGKPGILLEEQSLFHPDGSPTQAYRRIYHL